MILFVDDEPFFIDAYVEALKAAGHEVVVHKLVSEAMKWYERHRAEITLVISDVMMPQRGAFAKGEGPESDLHTGFALYDWFRKLSPMMPIIILTNKTTPDVDKKFSSEPYCWLYRKGPRCSPFKLVQQIKNLEGATEQ